MPRVRFRTFTRGWWPSGARDEVPTGALRRAKGIHPVKPGPIRSRWGSTAIVTLGNTIHSLIRFADVRFQGAATDFFRTGVAIKSALDGTRLSFLRMPPRVDAVDYLFVAGGGSLFKVDAAGAVTNWGIAAPPDGFAAADNGAGNLATGTYQYRVTFRNSVTGHRSNANPTPVSINIGASRQIRLTALPISSDAQVNSREIYRTTAGGAIFFRRAIINDNSTTTFDDNVADAGLETLVLEVENDVPFASFDDVVGPFAGRAWWIDSAAGRRGRIYYSPDGIPEGVQGFIELTNDDDPMQRIVIWNRNLFAFSESSLFLVAGTNEPFLGVPLGGAPGTTQGRTVAVTPFGLIYQANDGVRLFNGVQSQLAGFDALNVLFRGEALEGVAAFEGVIGEYANNEYVVSNQLTTLALDLTSQTWRDVGVATTALHFEQDTKELTAGLGIKEVIFEDEGVLTDDGAAIAFEVETGGAISDVAVAGVIQRVYVEADTNGQALTPTIVIGDDTTITMANLLTSQRETTEYPLNRTGRVVSVRLTGSLTNRVEVFGVEADIYLPVTAATNA